MCMGETPRARSAIGEVEPMQRKGSWHGEAVTWVRLQERKARLAKSNPYSVEGWMQSKSKFSTQYSTTPCFKKQTCNFLQAMSTRQITWRPPGARFFLLQRRKNRGRKTPLRAGGGPPALRTHPCIRRRGCSRTLYGVPGRFVTASVVRPGEQTACRCACAYDAAR